MPAISLAGLRISCAQAQYVAYDDNKKAKEGIMDDELYPQIEPYDTGHLMVSEDPPHRIWYGQYGNPHGEPVLFVHGGPGAAIGPDGARFFDPQRYRIVLYHQRGCGLSEPFLSLADNTTRHLVRDIVRLRAHLGIDGPMHVFGGSWGSFLALMYAISHPETVASLTLRGIFLGRDSDLYDAYQRDARSAPGDYTGGGRIFPEEWKVFVDFIPQAERGRMLDAYYHRIHGDGPDRLEAARRWYGWEDAILHLVPESAEKRARNLDNESEVLAQAVMETHYFHHHCFLPDYGDDNYILNNAGRIAHLPVTVVQGRYDECTPRKMADELVEALNAARAKQGLPPLAYQVTVAAHVMMEPENQKALVRAMNEQPRIAVESPSE